MKTLKEQLNESIRKDDIILSKTAELEEVGIDVPNVGDWNGETFMDERSISRYIDTQIDMYNRSTESPTRLITIMDKDGNMKCELVPNPNYGKKKIKK